VITLEHEQTHDGKGADFFDALTLDFADGERGAFGFVRVTRFPNASKTSSVVLLFAGGELVTREVLHTPHPIESWERASLNGLEITTITPFERFRVTASVGGATLELEANARSAPIGLDEDFLTRAASVERYEQICDVRGQMLVGEQAYEIDCSGRRAHAWGRRDWSRVEAFRSLHADSDHGESITVASVRPAGALGHGDELRTGRMIAGAEHSPPFEEVRISTVYGVDGLPAKVGLELHDTDEEFPERVAGVKICGASVDVEDERLVVVFMRWALDRQPAFGCYETILRS
jgi:hypothetical protein